MNLTSCTAYFTIFSISLSRHILLREEKQMKNWLEKQFRLSEFHTDVKTEILAGLTTFVLWHTFLLLYQTSCPGPDLTNM